MRDLKIGENIFDPAYAFAAPDIDLAASLQGKAKLKKAFAKGVAFAKQETEADDKTKKTLDYWEGFQAGMEERRNADKILCESGSGNFMGYEDGIFRVYSKQDYELVAKSSSSSSSRPKREKADSPLTTSNRELY